MQWPYVLGLGYSIMLVFIYGVIQLINELRLIAPCILFISTAGAAVVSSFWILRKYAAHNPKPAFSMAWICFSAGIFMFFLGALIIVAQITFLGTAPFPSFADFFYISGYLILGLGLFLIFKLFSPAFSNKMLTLSAVSNISLSAIVGYSLLTPIMTSRTNFPTMAFSAAYPILDAGLSVPILANFIIFVKGALGKAWFFLTLGIALNIVADLLFGYAELLGFYYEGHPLELFWLWGYVALLIGCYIHRREL
jgi:hypothetical protein